MDRQSILNMAMGAVEERVNLVMQEVIDNIQDPNTKPDKKRSMTITFEFLPNSDRSDIRVTSTVKSKLEPTSPITSTLCIGADSDGVLVAAEMTPSLPGQLNIAGAEQPQGIVIPLAKAL